MSTKTYTSIAAVKAANRDTGHYWFSEDAMEWFGTKVHGPLVAGHYFITSEQDSTYLNPAWNGDRRYSIRACFDGKISTVGEFGQYPTMKEAKHAIAQLAEMVSA